LVIGIVVVSHWVLDAISHRPDLPLVPGVGMYVGLGLWNLVPATMIVEGHPVHRGRVALRELYAEPGKDGNGQAVCRRGPLLSDCAFECDARSRSTQLISMKIKTLSPARSLSSAFLRNADCPAAAG
jgi:hypothetical protein